MKFNLIAACVALATGNDLVDSSYGIHWSNHDLAKIAPLPNAWEPDLVDPVRQQHTDKVIDHLKARKFSTEYHNDDNEWNN